MSNLLRRAILNAGDSLIQGIPTGNSQDFSTALPANTFDGVWDETNQFYYFGNIGDNTVKKLDSAGASLGNLTATTGSPLGITTDGTNIWYSTSGAVRKLDLAGVELGASGAALAGDGLATTASNPTLFGIRTAGDLIQEITKANTPVGTGFTFPVAPVSPDYRGMVIINNFIYLCNNVTQLVYIYNIDGTFVNSFDVSGAGANPFAIWERDGFLWVM